MMPLTMLFQVRAIWNELWAEFDPQWRAMGVDASRAHIYPSNNGEYFQNTMRLFPVRL